MRLIYNNEETCEITLPAITRSGFTIKGFNTSASATSEEGGWTSGVTVSVRASTTKTWYAITSKEVRITFEKNGASSITKTSDTCTIRNSATACFITSPDITASDKTPTVLGWNTSANSTSSAWSKNTEKSFSDNGTWYAITKKNAVTLTANWNANGNTLSSTTAKTCGLSATYNGQKQATSCTVDAPTITAPANTPTIVGFNTSATSTTNSSSYNTSTKKLTISGSGTWYAITKKDAVQRTATYNGNGSTSGSTSNSECTIAATYNGKAQATTCTVTLATNGFSKSGYSFNGWSTSSSATSGSLAGTSVTLSSNTTYYAIWNPQTISIAGKNDHRQDANGNWSTWTNECTGNTINQNYRAIFTISGNIDGLTGYLCYYNPEGWKCNSEWTTYKTYYADGSQSKTSGYFCFKSATRWIYYRSSECAYAYACNENGQCDSNLQCP